jgi:hypothetical protein
MTGIENGSQCLTEINTKFTRVIFFVKIPMNEAGFQAVKSRRRRQNALRLPLRGECG